MKTETERTETRPARPAVGGWSALAALALAAAWAAPALACPVCYGEASGEVIEGTRWSIAFLGGLVYLVLFGGVGMVVVARKRALAQGDARHGLHLVQGADAQAGTAAGERGIDEDRDDEETSER